MRILGNVTRLGNNRLKKSVFLVLVEYDDDSSYFGKPVKDTIYSLEDLTKATNFGEHKKAITGQMSFFSIDLATYKLNLMYQWIRKKF